MIINQTSLDRIKEQYEIKYKLLQDREVLFENKKTLLEKYELIRMKKKERRDLPFISLHNFEERYNTLEGRLLNQKENEVNELLDQLKENRDKFLELNNFIQEEDKTKK